MKVDAVDGAAERVIGEGPVGLDAPAQHYDGVAWARRDRRDSEETRHNVRKGTEGCGHEH